jgi:hypothetical protein
MVIRGLEHFGCNDLAREIALKHVAAVAEVYRETGTIWENYAPDSLAPGRHTNGDPVVRDMVGWSGIGPILFFLEYAVGLSPNASANVLRWDLRSLQRSGCARYRFNGHVLSLEASPSPGGTTVRLTVDTDGPFRLLIRYRGHEQAFDLPRGASTFMIRPL